MANSTETIDEAVRAAVARDYDGDAVVASSWMVVVSVELSNGMETSYGVYASPSLRQHEAHGLLIMAQETLPK